MRVLRIHHDGRAPAQRTRDVALAQLGVDVTLVVPRRWPQPDGEGSPPTDPRLIELPVRRVGDVNRHSYEATVDALRRLIDDAAPDLLDIHEEPFSVAARQWLAAAPPELPVVMYTAQNIDKRLPPPFAQYERAAFDRVTAIYPCTAQAASVVRGKGFAGLIEVLPLGFDDATFLPGAQSTDDDELVLSLVGRLVREKGVLDAVRVLARLHARRPTRLLVVGSGPEASSASALAGELGVSERLELLPWQSTEELAVTYRRTHVALVPSRPTSTWVEQFGRVIVEAQASGAVVAGYASGSIGEVAGEPALLTPVGDVSGLADGIAAVVTNAAEFEARRAGGIAQSRTRTWEQVAERQVELYRRVLRGDVPRMDRHQSPRRRRAAARAEWGLTATSAAGVRPFALPVLRGGGLLAAALGAAIDGGAEARARLRRSPRARG